MIIKKGKQQIRLISREQKNEIFDHAKSLGYTREEIRQVCQEQIYRDFPLTDHEGNQIICYFQLEVLVGLCALFGDVE